MAISNNIRPGRHFLQIPGPTNVPDRVLRAMDYPTIDHRGPDFAELGLRVLDRIKLVFKTSEPVIIFPASGTGAWEAALVNTLSAGDKILMFETGHFSTLWWDIAQKFKIEVDFVKGDWRTGVDPNIVEQKLKEEEQKRKDVDLKVREEEQKLKEQKEQRRKRKEQKIINEQEEILKAAEMKKIKEWGEKFEIQQKLKEEKEILKEEKLKKAEEERRLKYWGDDKFNEEKEIHSEESADGPEVIKKDLN